MPENRIGFFSQLVPPAPRWTVGGVPDQTGKVVIVTGGNRGIGKEMARVLLSRGAKVYIATRSEERAQSSIDELKQATGQDSIFILKLDLADLPSVKAAAEEFVSKESELHTLYNNAGVMYTPVDMVTTQGYDLQFGTNVLGHFYFTKLLLPALTATAKKSPEKTVRMVNLSSLDHYHGPREGIRWTTLTPSHESLEARKGLGSARLFGQSKTVRTLFVFFADTNRYLICRKGNILFSNELARRYGGEGIVSIALHPGIDTSSHAGSLVLRIGDLFKYALYYVVSCGDMSRMMERRQAVVVLTENTRAHAVANIALGDVPTLPTIDTTDTNSHFAITSLYAGTAPAAGKLNGKYLTAWARVTLPHGKALNPDEEKKLWEWCEDQVKDIDNKVAT